MLHIHTEIIQDGKGESGKYEEPLDLSIKDLWLHVAELVNENPGHRYVYHFIEKDNERDTNINDIYLFEYVLFVITETKE